MRTEWSLYWTAQEWYDIKHAELADDLFCPLMQREYPAKGYLVKRLTLALGTPEDTPTTLVLSSSALAPTPPLSASFESHFTAQTRHSDVRSNMRSNLQPARNHLSDYAVSDRAASLPKLQRRIDNCFSLVSSLPGKKRRMVELTANKP